MDGEQDFCASQKLLMNSLTVRNNAQITAVLQASFVTVLWASSWILIKLGLRADLPALTFAGLRYTLAFVCLAPFVFLRPGNRVALRSLTSRDWSQLTLLGVVYYTLTQGAQFLSLAYLPAAMVSLLLNLTPLIVGMFGIVFLNEHPSNSQWLGIGLTIAGLALYFFPLGIERLQLIGLLGALAGMLSNAASALLGRQVNRMANNPALIVTFISMGVGAVLLLVIGILFQGIGTLNWQSGSLILWLAMINTAIAFTLWNHTLRTLSAVESSIINSLMMPQIAILAFVFLGEALNGRQILGLLLVSLGVIVVQLRKE
jgi:drug/metabolite transporter (DMT)-like permease